MIFNSLSNQLKIIDDKRYSLPKRDHCNLQPIRMWGTYVKFTLNQVSRNVGRVLHNLCGIPCHIQTIKTSLIENQTRNSIKMRIQFIKFRFISHFRTINYIAYKKKKAKEAIEHPLTGLGASCKITVGRRRDGGAWRRKYQWAQERLRGGDRSWCCSFGCLGFVAPLWEPQCPHEDRGGDTFDPTTSHSKAKFQSSRRTGWSCPCASWRLLQTPTAFWRRGLSLAVLMNKSWLQRSLTEMKNLSVDRTKALQLLH